MVLRWYLCEPLKLIGFLSIGTYNRALFVRPELFDGHFLMVSTF